MLIEAMIGGIVGTIGGQLLSSLTAKAYAWIRGLGQKAAVEAKKVENEVKAKL